MNVPKSTLTFLKDLAANNDRDWFAANKPRYEKARDEFVEFIGELVQNIAKFDPEVAKVDPKKSVFRIYRDTRFSLKGSRQTLSQTLGDGVRVAP